MSNRTEPAIKTTPNKYFGFSVAADIVALGIRKIPGGDWRQQDNMQMSIVLVKRGRDPFMGDWAVPGGFFRRDFKNEPDDQDLETCARREMLEETGLTVRALIPFGNFSALGRDPRGKGYLSIPYLAIINLKDMTKALPHGGDDAAEAKWFSVRRTKDAASGNMHIVLQSGQDRIAFVAQCKGEGLGQPKVKITYEKGSQKLAFDHAEIIATAIFNLGLPGKRLRAFAFLGEEFTIAELRCVYDFMAGVSSIPQNFRRSVIGYLESTGRELGDKGHRPAVLYRWKGVIPE